MVSITDYFILKLGLILSAEAYTIQLLSNTAEADQNLSQQECKYFKNSKYYNFCKTMQSSLDKEGKWLSLLTRISTKCINHIALRKAKIVCNFGFSECNRVKIPFDCPPVIFW